RSMNLHKSFRCATKAVFPVTKSSDSLQLSLLKSKLCWKVCFRCAAHCEACWMTGTTNWKKLLKGNGPAFWNLCQTTIQPTENKYTWLQTGADEKKRGQFKMKHKVY